MLDQEAANISDQIIFVIRGCTSYFAEKSQMPAKIAKELTDNIDVASEDNNLQQLAAADKTYQFLEESLNELNEEQRQCVILFYIKKCSYHEICDKTGYQLMQVKSYIQNGKRNLKIILERKLKQSI